ncbi:MAG TPA: response regulator [Bryobacteraceae bacterium]|nr:response regulator [Bryobacteraceae bacterium]
MPGKSFGLQPSPGYGCFDGGGEMGALIRSMDWSATPLGPVEQWPQPLRTSVSTCLNSRFAILVWWGPDLIMLYNDAYREIIAGKHPAALGRPGRECWPEIWDIIGPMLHGVIERGEATRSDDLLLLLERHGYPEECYFTFSYSPIRDDSGTVVGVFTPVAETTERVIGERRLRTLRDLASRGSIAKSPCGACRAAAETLLANPYDVPFAALYLYSQDRSQAALAAAAGIEAGSPVSPLSIGFEAADPGVLARATRNSQIEEIRGLSGLDGIPGGAWPVAPETALVLPLVSPGRPQPSGFLVAGVSPRKRLDPSYRAFFELAAGHIATAIAGAEAYEHERRRAEKLAELDRAKTAFFSNVSHEFRTPLTLMIGPLEELLARAGLGLPRQELELIHRNALRLLKLVNNLLDFARIEAGRVEARYQPVDLARFTAGLVSVFRSAIEKAGLSFIIDCPPLPEPVYVDCEMWEKIVLNLLSNALKFTFEGEIAVSLRHAGQHVELSVRDTGIGIRQSDLRRVFERFHRIEDARGRTHEGSGIGLALVQELARLNGGGVRVESVYGQGATFTVSIPTGCAHLPAERIGKPHAETSPAQVSPYIEEALGSLPGSAGPATAWAGDWPQDLLLKEEPPGEAGARRARILLADDNADLRNYLRRTLLARYDVEAVADGEAALAAIARRMPDLVVADVMMPRLDGFGLLERIRAAPELATLPVVLLSARAGEEARVEGLHAGADDYLTKPFSARELLARIASHLTISELRREARRRLEESENLFRTLSDSIPQLAWMARPDGSRFWYNRRWYEYTGATPEEMEGWGWRSVHHPDHAARVFERQRKCFAAGIVWEDTVPLRGKDGAYRWFLSRAVALRDSAGEIARWLGTNTDITEQREAEVRLREAHKLESLGVLAGGVAHDFNNILVGVLGNASLVREMLPAGSEAAGLVQDIETAAERAADLTRQMLAYAGRGKFVVEQIDISAAVRQAAELLRPSLSKRIELHLDLDQAPPAVEADPAQIQQVIMNIVLNAAEAMDDRAGRIDVKTWSMQWNPRDEGQAVALGAPAPGPYICLEVRDTGCGMDENTKARIFDPFFSTKFTGRGLGLAAVAGIVRGHRGAIRIDSTVGRGTTIQVMFPCLPVASATLPAPEAPAKPEPAGRGTLLVIDDEAVVRRHAMLALESQGYHVVLASSGLEAIEFFQRDPSAFDLVLLDLSMPGMDGRETFDALHRIHPEVKVIIFSGYSEQEILRRFTGRSIAGFIQKPYRSSVLAAKVEEMLAHA